MHYSLLHAMLSFARAKDTQPVRKTGYEVLLRKGKQEFIEYGTFSEAFGLFAIAMDKEDPTIALHSIQYVKQDGKMDVQWKTERFILEMHTNIQPDYLESIYHESGMEVNWILLSEIHKRLLC